MNNPGENQINIYCPFMGQDMLKPFLCQQPRLCCLDCFEGMYLALENINNNQIPAASRYQTYLANYFLGETDSLDNYPNITNDYLRTRNLFMPALGESENKASARMFFNNPDSSVFTDVRSYEKRKEAVKKIYQLIARLTYSNDCVFRHSEPCVDHQKNQSVEIDFSHFKPFNDRVDYMFGNEVLLKCEKRLNEKVGALRGNEVGRFARIGGDEFLFFVCNNANCKKFEGVNNSFVPKPPSANNSMWSEKLGNFVEAAKNLQDYIYNDFPNEVFDTDCEMVIDNKKAFFNFVGGPPKYYQQVNYASNPLMRFHYQMRFRGVQAHFVKCAFLEEPTPDNLAPPEEKDRLRGYFSEKVGLEYRLADKDGTQRDFQLIKPNTEIAYFAIFPEQNTDSPRNNALIEWAAISLEEVFESVIKKLNDTSELNGRLFAVRDAQCRKLCGDESDKLAILAVSLMGEESGIDAEDSAAGVYAKSYDAIRDGVAAAFDSDVCGYNVYQRAVHEVTTQIASFKNVLGLFSAALALAEGGGTDNMDKVISDLSRIISEAVEACHTHRDRANAMFKKRFESVVKHESLDALYVDIIGLNNHKLSVMAVDAEVCSKYIHSIAAVLTDVMGVIADYIGILENVNGYLHTISDNSAFEGLKLICMNGRRIK